MGLPEITLAAIVRDEMVNPAGGIQDFLDATVPYVHEAVIVDTGSVDGTREMLEKAQSRYANLRVIDHKFDGYASSRNVSLKHVRTEHALILDADERITPEDLAGLPDEIAQTRLMQYDVRFTDVWHVPSLRYGIRLENEPGKGHNPRLFSMKGDPHYVNDVWEWLVQDGLEPALYPEGLRTSSSAVISHYRGTRQGRMLKDQLWYDRVATGDMSLSPAQVPYSSRWKRIPETKPLLTRLQEIFF